MKLFGSVFFNEKKKKRSDSVTEIYFMTLPSGFMTYMQHRIKGDATSGRYIDVGTKLPQCHMPAG